MNLKKGDCIGLISQSWCGPEVFPHVFDKGIENLNKLGFKTKEFNFTRKQGSPEQRAKDLTDAFLDEEVKGIICSIGGDDCAFLIEHLDIELLKKHKKPIMGYSDPTALFVFLSQHGIPCYYGPTVMAGFSHMHFYKEWFNYIGKIMSGEKPPLIPFEEYNDGYEDWSAGVIELNPKKKNSGFNFLSAKTGTGKLFGGCLEVLEFIKGASYWPDLEFWDDKILFLETSDDKPSLTQIKYALRNYGFSKILNRIKGIIFGRARNFSDDEKKQLDELIIKTLSEFNVRIPVVTNVDFGHTDPQFILRYGDEVIIDNNTLSYSKDK